MRQLITIEEHERLRGNRGILWAGGPPPEDDVYNGPLMTFIKTFERTGSIKMARRDSKLLAAEVDRFIGQSPWFCQQINAAINETRREMIVSSLTRATGYTKEDPETGKHVVDADGRVIYFNASDAMARLWLESPVPESGAIRQVTDGENADDPGPLLPSNVDQHRQLQIDDCRLALDALRPAVRAGDRQAIDTFTKVQDRLAKLSGTDAPKQSISYIGGGALARLTDDELHAIAAGGVALVKGPDGVYSADDDAGSS